MKTHTIILIMKLKSSKTKQQLEPKNY